MSEQIDLCCRMKCCLDCREWKLLEEFNLRKRGAGMGRLSYCKPCSLERWRIRNEKRKVKREGSAFANRIPVDTSEDYVQHAFLYLQQRKFHLVDLAISQAPEKLRPKIKRELVALARAA